MIYITAGWNNESQCATGPWINGSRTTIDITRNQSRSDSGNPSNISHSNLDLDRRIKAKEGDHLR
jgi:hypothetical protein